MSEDLSQAMRDIIDERRRQVDVEGRSPEHDDYHNSSGQLAKAAASSAAPKISLTPAEKLNPSLISLLALRRRAPDLWPWPWVFWKPKDRRRNLVRAAALLVAEVERLDRKHAWREDKAS